MTIYGDLLNWLQTERHYKTEKKTQALKAIEKAVIETTKYVHKTTNKGMPKNKVEEMRLSTFWMEAAALSNPLFKKLGEKLGLKSQYWKNPDTWNVDQIEDEIITIEQIEKEIKKILHKRDYIWG